MPSDDTSLVGGSIDASMRVVFSDYPFMLSDVIELVSDNGGDSGITATVTIMNVYGTVIFETRTMEGAFSVPFNNLGYIGRLERVQLSGPALGTITVRLTSRRFLQDGATPSTIGTIPPGELGFTRMFVGAFADTAATKVYYQKFFWKNTSGSSTFYDPEVSVAANPSLEITQCLAITNDDAGTSVNRITVPVIAVLSPPSIFDDIPRDGPANLTPGQAIGVWLSLTLAPGQGPQRSFVTSMIFGGTPSP